MKNRYLSALLIASLVAFFAPLPSLAMGESGTTQFEINDGANLAHDTAKIDVLATDVPASKVVYWYDAVDGSITIGESSTPSQFEYIWDTSALPDGSYAVYVMPYDMNGVAEPDAVSMLTLTVSHVVPAPDVTAPTLSILTPTNGQRISGTANLNVSVSDAESGVNYVDYSIDGARVARSYFQPYGASIDTHAYTDGAHTLTVTAYDEVYNASTQQEQIVVDNSGPTVSVTAPAEGASVTGTVALSASATDASGVSKVEFSVDGALVGTSTVAPYQVSWNTASFAPGTHTITAKAYDTLGNTSVATAHASVKDLVAPVTSITSPANNSYVTKGNWITVNASASDNVGVSKVEIYINGVLSCQSSLAPYTCSFIASSQPKKVYTLQSVAYDAAGNKGSSSIVTVTTK